MTRTHTEIPHQSKQSMADFLRILKEAGICASHYYDSMPFRASHPDHITKSMKRCVLNLEKEGFTQASWSPFDERQYRVLTHPIDGRVLITPDLIPSHAGYELRSNSGDTDVAAKALRKSRVFAEYHIHPSFIAKIDNDPRLLTQFALFQHQEDASFFMLIDWWSYPPTFD